jgi:hypothetical protein
LYAATREQRADDVGDRLRIHADGDWVLELRHHGERIVVAPDDFHAEHSLGRCAKDGCGDRRCDDRGKGGDGGDFSDAAGQP